MQNQVTVAWSHSALKGTLQTSIHTEFAETLLAIVLVVYIRVAKLLRLCS
jgi:hypothetical protein